MLLRDITPFIRHVRHFAISDATPSAHKDVRTRDNRIFFVTDGAVDITVGENEYTLHRDSLILIRSGEFYRLDPLKNSSITVINFDFTENFSAIKQSFHPFSSDFPGVLENIAFDDAPCLRSHIVLENAGRLSENISSLVDEFYQRSEWSDAYLSAVLKAMIIDIARTAACAVPSRNTLVKNVIRYMQEHYSERVENETLSEHFHFTSVYINRVFKREMGISIRKYLIALRIDIAKELLISGECSPSEAAIATGFDDYPHFSKTFKALTGKSPREYCSSAYFLLI